MQRGTRSLLGDDDSPAGYSELPDNEKRNVDKHVQRLLKKAEKPEFRWSRLSENWRAPWDAVADMNGSEFEDFVRFLCIARGYTLAPRLKKSKDEGVDIYVTNPEIIIQCKRGNVKRKLGPDQVKLLFATCVHKGVSHGMLFTNQEFSSGAANVCSKLRDAWKEVRIDFMGAANIHRWVMSDKCMQLKDIFADPKRMATYLVSKLDQFAPDRQSVQSRFPDMEIR